MSSTIIDRRLNGRHKSLPNRERFIRRYKEQIKRSIGDTVASGSIKDIAKDGSVRVPIKDTVEPQYSYGEGGDREIVVPGNQDFVPGDRIPRPNGGGGRGSGRGEPGEGEGEDSFSFVLSREEFLELYFEDLELPELLRKDLAQTVETKPMRAGFTKEGSPTQLSVVRTMKASLARRVALSEPDAEERALIEELDTCINPFRVHELQEQIALKESQRLNVPMLDDVDLRYRNSVQVPQPATNAVMFCVMDVSGSMDEHHKDLAKRFFTLLYLFLNRKYEKVELVFVRHTDEAEEVSEEEFFYGRKSGGTLVHRALELVDDIITERYPASSWNIYLAQASDGDAMAPDAHKCKAILTDSLFKQLRYMAYIEVTEGSTAQTSPLLDTYRELAKANHAMGVRKVARRNELYPVFRSLFEKKS